MKDSLGDRQRLLHILDAIAEIETYIHQKDIDSFLNNSMMRFASIKQLEIIGEAAKHLSNDTKLKFSSIEWNQIVGMRNVLVHEYFGVDNLLVWQIIIDDLPKLKERIQVIFHSNFQ
jgi:uncharacterized protein with HEPN domain